jgi:hypothetical protein
MKGTALLPHHLQRVGKSGSIELGRCPIVEESRTHLRQLLVFIPQVCRLMRVTSHVEQHLVRPMTVVAVMPSAEVEVIRESDASLTGPRALRKHQMVPPDIAAKVNR